MSKGRWVEYKKRDFLYGSLCMKTQYAKYPPALCNVYLFINTHDAETYPLYSIHGVVKIDYTSYRTKGHAYFSETDSEPIGYDGLTFLNQAISLYD